MRRPATETDVEYCCFDVKCTKRVLDFGIAKRQLFYNDRFQQRRSVAVEW